MIENQDYIKAKELNLTNLNRWEDGIDHHSMSKRLVEFMADHDFNDYNDSMCIKIGGDGDNGEHMMYITDAFFEMLDKENKRMTEKEILSWMMDAYTMLGEKDDKGEDEGKSLLHALINIVNNQNK